MYAWKRGIALLLCLLLCLGVLPGTAWGEGETVRQDFMLNWEELGDAPICIEADCKNEDSQEIFVVSDSESYYNGWYYYLDYDNHNVLRSTDPYDYEDEEERTDYPVNQIAMLDGILYVSTGNQIIADDQTERTVIADSSGSIQRFALCGSSLIYLSNGKIYSLDLNSNELVVLTKNIQVTDFWLENKNTLSYLVNGLNIYSMDFVSGLITSRNNISSSLEDKTHNPDPSSDQTALSSLSVLQAKFPNGKYWNHAGNPGASNSVNNQDGYTSTPCSVHGVVGTARQECNGFQPGNTQLSWQCMGYAEKCGYDMTGFNPRNNANGWNTSYSSSALNNLKAGDIVRYKNDGHSIYVTAVSGDIVTYTDCNGAGSAKKCIIRWGETITKSTLKSTFSYVRIAPKSPEPDPISVNIRASTIPASSVDIPAGGTSFPQGSTIYVNGTVTSGAPVNLELYIALPGQSDSQATKTDWETGINYWFYLGDHSTGGGYKLTQSGSYHFILRAYNNNDEKWYAAYIESVASTVHPTGVSLDKSALELQISSWQGGTSGTLSATVYPSNATDKSLTWSSSNTNVATVDGNGTVTATGPGSATITVRTNDGGKTASCAVTVVQKYYLDLNGCWNGENQTTLAGLGTADVYVNGVLQADDVEDYYVLWPAGTTYEFRDIKPYDSRSYNGIASGARQGTINGDSALVLDFTPINTSGIGSPAATLTENGHIYRYYSDAVTWYTAKQFCEEQGGHLATVSSDAENTLLRNLIGNNLAWLGGTCISGSWKWVTGEAFSFGATGKTYPWKSTEPNDSPSDEGGENYLHFSETLWNDNAGCYRCGFLFEKEVATYTIQYNANGGSGAPAAQTKTQGVTLTLSSTIPTRSGYTFLGWAESSTATTAQYQPGGSFTKNANTTLYAVWKSNVVSVTGVTLNKTSLTLNKGASETLTATVSPSNATNKSVTWSSSNTSVATVDSNGKVTAVSAGTATITVKTNDGGKTATCAVTVKPKTYTVTYNANGGTSAPAAQTKTQGVPLTLSSTVPTRSGYTFLGWAESSTATTAQYQPGGSFTKNANTTLYAVWKQTPATSGATVSVSSTTAKQGDTVQLSVSLENNPGIASFEFDIVYEKRVLEWTGIQTESIGGTWDAEVGKSVYWGDADNYTGNGRLFTLIFRVLDTDAESTQVSLQYQPNNVYNENEVNVDCTIHSGTVTISSYMPGDINGDGVVNNKDITRLMRYLRGYSVEVVSAALDVNGDGTVNNKDITRLMRYVRGYSVTIY